MVEIIPSILVSSEGAFKTQLNALRDVLPMIQLDIADGKFVPSTTWADPEVVTEVIGEMEMELHLMVEYPLAEIERWADVPNIIRVLFHAESKDDDAEVIEQIHNYGWEASMVLNPDTPIDALDPYLDDLEGVMFMGVVPGAQGQGYIPKTTERIKAFNAKETDHFVELDGAVNEETLPDILQAELDAVCPGSAISGNDRTPEENVHRMEELINRLTQ